MKKAKIACLICAAITLAAFVVFACLIRIVAPFKFVAAGFLLVFAAFSGSLWIMNILNYKKRMQEEMPIFLTELYNAGIINKEQLEKPGKVEKEMFFSEFNGPYRKRILFLVLFLFVCVQLSITFFFV